MSRMTDMHSDASFVRGTRTNESGFTVIEAIIAVLLTSLVVGLAYSSYTFLSRMIEQWKTRMTLENTSHQIVRDWTDRARDAVKVKVEDNSWQFVSPSGRTTRYHHADQTLLRDNRPMHGVEVAVVEARIERHRQDQTNQTVPSNLNFRLDNESQSPTPDDLPGMIRIRVTLATTIDTQSLETTVHLRQPERWTSSPIERSTVSGERR